MSYSIFLRKKALSLRRNGASIKSIAKTLHIAQSTSSVWLQNVRLSNKTIEKLKKNKLIGQYKTVLIRKEKRNNLLRDIDIDSINKLENISFNKSIFELLASFLVWTEGGKSAKSYVAFINSDPLMVRTFLCLLRKSFTLDEKKLRALIHIHNYHKDFEIRKYWSKLTNIPEAQFSKSYKKLSTKHRIRKDYKGCIRIRYYDYNIALQLRSFYNSFANKLGS